MAISLLSFEVTISIVGKLISLQGKAFVTYRVLLLFCIGVLTQRRPLSLHWLWVLPCDNLLILLLVKYVISVI